MNAPNSQFNDEAVKSKYQALLNGRQITRDRIHHFEEKYDMLTSEFLERFAQNEFQHSFDFDEWIGESRMLKRFEKKLARLRDIQIAD